MSELIGLPRPPAVGASALPAGTFDGTTVFVTGAGTGLGKAIAAEFAPRCRDRDREPQGRASRRRPRRDRSDRRAVVTVTCDIRDADQIAAAFDTAERESGSRVCS